MKPVCVLFLSLAIALSLLSSAAAAGQDDPTRRAQASGQVQRGSPAVLDTVLGVDVQDVTEAIASAFAYGTDKGALVTAVEPGSAGFVAGVQVGDIVVAVEGEAVRNAAHLIELVHRYAPGTRLDVDVWRTPYPVPLTIVVPAGTDRSGNAERQAPASS